MSATLLVEAASTAFWEIIKKWFCTNLGRHFLRESTARTV